MERDRARGCNVERIDEGADYIRTCPGEEPTYVEVKDGCHDISPKQESTMREVREEGGNYEVERCNCEENEQ